MIQWHIGCSGFHYKDWKEIFYPKGLPQKKWFEYYCQHFGTIELNVTFYRFPQVTVLKNWYEKSPADFSFAVKAPRLITHYKKMNDCEHLLDNFYNTVAEGLKEKAACILFQFPPQFEYTEERLEKIIDNLNPAFPNVVEFRNSDWWHEKIYKKLAKNKITFSGMSHPSLPETVIANTSLLYYRMHGVPRLYHSSYSTEFLKKVTEEIKSFAEVKKAFIYFNNDFDGVGIENAKEMEKMVERK